MRLLQLIAFQIGNEVSLSKIGKQLAMSKNTVKHYLDLLEKVFVIFRLNGFSRNLRKEIDLVEEHLGNLSAYEIKWGQSRVIVPKDWRRHYPHADFNVIHKGNYLDYILRKEL